MHRENTGNEVMRIATWNLQSDKPLVQEREALFRQAMNDVNPDVWVFTEAWEEFTPGVDYRLAAMSNPADDLSPASRRWVAIWVRSNLATTQQVVQVEPDRMACALVKIPGQRDVVVIGTDLPWHFDKRWLYSTGFCAALTIQTAEWKRIWRMFPSCIYLVAGDFNQSLPYKERRGSEKGGIALNDALKSHALRCVTEGNDSLTSLARIDHICVSQIGLRPPFVPGDWAIPRIGEKEITDHSGVFADVNISLGP